jgi:RimJ/RimL family protein N-acetyltransferase
MLEAANYSAFETLRDGRRVEIRALRPDDRADLIAAVDRTSAQSLYRRFFGVRRGFTDQEIAFFLNVDFVNHVALVAVVGEGGYPTIVGGGRYVVVQPGTAEVAFAVVDEYQGQGIGAALMRHLAAIACRVEVKQFIAEVLPDNNPMLKVFEKSGFRLSTTRESNFRARHASAIVTDMPPKPSPANKCFRTKSGLPICALMRSA